MAASHERLLEEFVQLRRGWGLAGTNLRRRVGPELTSLVGVEPGDPDRMIRHKVVTAVKRWSTDLSDEDRVAIDVALGVADVQHHFLSDRTQTLATRLNIAERTARRRMDHAFARLADEAAAESESSTAAGGDDPEHGWYVKRLSSLLRLDEPTPAVTESRTIVALRDGLKAIAIRFSVPRSEPGSQAERNLLADVIHGARLVSSDRVSQAHYRFLLDLPRAIGRSESHTFSMRFSLPEGQPMRTHYALVPLFPIDSFDIRIRFDPARLPAIVWRFERLAPQTLNEELTPTTPLAIDDAGEVVQSFDHLERGFGYGIAWRVR